MTISFFRCGSPHRFWLAAAVLLQFMLSHAAQSQPEQERSAPILLLRAGSQNFAAFYAEILRNEGFNSFDVAEIEAIDATTLDRYDVVLLAKGAVSAEQAALLESWVNAGGNLIAMDPAPQLAGLLGIASTSTTLSEGYLKVDGSFEAGRGLVIDTMQFHGIAQLSSLNGASALAMFYANATEPTTFPAITLRAVGTAGGQAAAFLYDLATSVVYTRQGNPAWASQERDGQPPIRPDDKFYGAAAGDPQRDWVHPAKIAIAQADEQVRLLSNLIVSMSADRKPLPRFWYFPDGHKAVLVMTGDDHARNGTATRFAQFQAASPRGCSVARWQCVRGTSYLFPEASMSDAQAALFAAAGFEIGLHINTQCLDFDRASLERIYAAQVASFRRAFPSVPPLLTQRHHCIAWSDWVTAAKVQLAYGMRLDTSYYYWPPQWVRNVPGHFTGSAMPMRFADLDGTIVDVYQVVTQMTDESGQEYPFTVDTLLDRALGEQEQYGVYTINAHTDKGRSVEADAALASAQARGVPIISARQLLTWLDGRAGSTFDGLRWSDDTLRFDVRQAKGADGLQVLLPRRIPGRQISTITRGGLVVPFRWRTIKGIEYAAFGVSSGSYVASYLGEAAAASATRGSGAVAFEEVRHIEDLGIDSLERYADNALPLLEPSPPDVAWSPVEVAAIAGLCVRPSSDETDRSDLSFQYPSSAAADSWVRLVFALDPPEAIGPSP